jgi:endo-1,4-beta-xylanase
LDASKPVGGPLFHNFISEVQQLGLKVLITELDVTDQNVNGSIQARDTAVADTYKNYLESVFSLVGTPEQIIFWTVSDRNNWLDWEARTNQYYRRPDGQAHRPGLLDNTMQSKPALQGVREALRLHSS